MSHAENYSVKVLASNQKAYCFEAVDSTNEVLKAHLGTGNLQTGDWLVAKRQLAGKGTRGRQWVSDPGNLYASTLVDVVSNPSNLGQLALVAGLAAFDAVQDLCPSVAPRLAVKWPNDLMIDGKKLAGILIETIPSDSKRANFHRFVVGFGVNVANYPPSLAAKACSLRQEVGKVTGNEMGNEINEETSLGLMLEHLDQRLDMWKSAWSNGDGFPLIRDSWLSRCIMLGNECDVITGDKRVRGVMIGIGDSGQMLLRSDGVIQSVYSGSIFD